MNLTNMTNSSIAQTHRTYRKWVGKTVAQSALLAFIANTLVVPAGLLVLASYRLTINTTSVQSAIGSILPNIVVWCFLIVLGVMLALIADGMTLGACARLRRALEKRALIKEEYARVPEELKHTDVRASEQAELKLLRPSYSFNIVCIIFFGTVSAVAGIIFWHRFLEPLGFILAWIASTLFSVVITGTLIASEVFKVSNNDVVRESIVSDHYTSEASNEDNTENALAALQDRYKTRIEELAQNTDTINVAIEQHAQSVYDNLLAGGKGLIPAAISRERINKQIERAKEKEQVRTQMQLIKGAPESISLSQVQNTEPLQIAGKRKDRKDGAKNYTAIEALYLTKGEDYIKNNIADVASDLGVTDKTVYKHLNEIKAGTRA